MLNQSCPQCGYCPTCGRPGEFEEQKKPIWSPTIEKQIQSSIDRYEKQKSEENKR